jgi:hypothetical protein
VTEVFCEYAGKGDGKLLRRQELRDLADAGESWTRAMDVLAINALMFLVQGWAGLLVHSTSVLADALDMLGDALVYGFSLYVLAHSAVAIIRSQVLRFSTRISRAFTSEVVAVR